MHPVGNSCTAGKRFVTEGRLPVPSNDELGTTQKLSSIQIRPGKIGAIECRFEEVRILHVVQHRNGTPAELVLTL